MLPKIQERPDLYEESIRNATGRFVESHLRFKYPFLRRYSINKKTIRDVWRLGKTLDEDSGGKLAGIGLYGSHARGYPSPSKMETDVDLILLWRENTTPLELDRLEDRARSILRKLGGHRTQPLSIRMDSIKISSPENLALAFNCAPIYNALGFAEFKKKVLEHLYSLKSRERKDSWNSIRDEEKRVWRISMRNAAARIVNEICDDISREGIFLSRNAQLNEEARNELFQETCRELIDRRLPMKIAKFGLKQTVKGELERVNSEIERIKQRGPKTGEQKAEAFKEEPNFPEFLFPLRKKRPK
ncbi:nucleotidyltransferase domain-containing protein [Candidatus Micrarchaeota archaeon]|nr:nucleotidyltransferase domain-containing protein [Candidatus Micrarchaeota archaeon]